ncbi:MAG: PAS domain S-box protein [Bacteroidales bacterium]|nr:PAS domain S-box protein [Bacteroidales bacterium]
MAKTAEDRQNSSERLNKNSGPLIVGIGASAGGLESLQEFFQNIPEESDIAYIVIYYLSQREKISLKDFLTHNTKLEIDIVSEGSKLIKNRVYFVPDGYSVRLVKNKLYLQQHSEIGLKNLSLDILFKSLADEVKDKAVGIILSGNGTEGMQGLKYISDKGGMILVQTIDSCKYSTMPGNALSTGLVDYELPANEMPGVITNYVSFLNSKNAPEEEWTDENLNKIIHRLRLYSGVDFSFYRKNVLIERIRSRILINGLSSQEEYINLLGGHDHEKELLYKKLLAGVSGFLYDQEGFETIANNVIPTIIDRKQDNVRVWCIGSSKGEEAFSIAILFKEHLAKSNLDVKVKIFATDIDRQMLDFARRAFYPVGAVAELNPETLNRYFVQYENGFQVSEEIRKMVVFARHDLIKDNPFLHVDMILCRNLLVDVKPDIKAHLINKFEQSLNNNGYLILGGNETVSKDSNSFFPVDSLNSIYQLKKTANRNTSVHQEKEEKHSLTTEKCSEYAGNKTGESNRNLLFNTIADKFLPPTIIFDNSDNIVQTINDIKPVIRFKTGEYSRDIYSVRPRLLAVYLSGLLREIRKKPQRVVYKNIRNIDNLTGKSLDIEGYLIQMDEMSYCVVFFHLRDTEYTKDNETEISVEGDADKVLKNDKTTIIKDISEKTEKEKLLSDEIDKADRILSAIESGKAAWWEWDTGRELLDHDRKNPLIDNLGLNELFRDSGIFYKKVHPSDLNKVKEQIEAIKIGEYDVLDVTFRLRISENNYGWIYNRAKVTQWNNNDYPAKITGIIFDISEYKQPGSESDSKKKDVELLLDKYNQAAIMLDNSGKIVHLNREAKRFFNLSSGDYQNESVDHVNWSLRDQNRQPVANENLPFKLLSKQKNEINSYRYILNAENKEDKLVEFTGSPVFDEYNQYLGSIFFITETEHNNITTDSKLNVSMMKKISTVQALRNKIESTISNNENFQKDTENIASELLEHLNGYQKEQEDHNKELLNLKEELEKSKSHYQDIYDNAPIGYVIFKDKMKIFSTNHAFRNMMGLEEKEHLKNIIDYIHVEDQHTFKQHLEFVKETNKQKSIELTLVSEHKHIPVKVISNKINNKNSEEEIRSAFIELTEEKELEKDLKRTLEKFTAAFRTSPDVMIISKLRDGTFIEVNDSFKGVTGYNPEDVIGKKINDLDIWVDKLFREEYVEKLKNDGIVRDIEGAFRRKDGSVGYLRMSGTIITVDGDKCILAVFQDISNEKASADRISHLNNVLTAVRRVNQLIVREKDSKQLADKINHTLTKYRGYDSAWIIFTDDKKQAEYISMSGLELNTQETKKVQDELVEYCAQRALKKGELIHIEKGDPGCEGCPLEPLTPDNDVLLKRLESGRNIFGIIAVSLPGEMALDINEQGLFIELARDVSYALKSILEEEKRVNAEKTLKASEEKYKYLFENATVGIFRMDSSGNLIFVNPEMAEILNAGNEKQVVDHYKDIDETFFLNFRDKAEFLKILETKGKVENFRFKGRAIDDVEIRLKMNAQVSDTTPDNTFIIDGFITDVTTQLEAMEMKKESDEKFREIFENVNDAIFMYKVEPDGTPGKILETNKRACEMLGYTKEELLSMPINQIHGEGIGEMRSFVEELMQEGYSSYKIMTKARSGDTVPMEINSHLFKLNNEDMIISVGRDITERLRSAQALEDSERRFSIAVESAGIGVWELNLKTSEIIWNDWMYRLYGIDPDEFQNNIGYWYDKLHPDDYQRVKDELESVATTSDQFNTEFRINKPGDGVRYLKAYAIVIKEEGYDRIVGVNYDITDRKNYEELLRNQNREYEAMNEELIETNQELYKAKEKAEESDRLKSAFLANMSHEIRTPLNGILGFSDLLTMSDISQKQKLEYFSIIKKNGERLMRLIDDLIDISKIEADQVELEYKQTDLNQLLKELEAVFQQQNDKEELEIKCSYSENGRNLIVMTDPNRLSQVMTNLLRNSMKFTAKGSISFGYKQEENYIKFYVKDTGVGINPEIQDVIFKRFRQGTTTLDRPYEGSGLGLSISQGIIELLGGDIWFDTERNKGTTFYFTLPLKDSKNINDEVQQETEDRDNHISDADEKSLKGKKALLVEDDETSMILITQNLKDAGMEVIGARNGKQAVEYCDDYDIDIVLMDVKLPVMDGYEATGEIKKNHPDIPVIAQTAYAMRGDKEKAIQAGCDEYVSKPINKENLINLINKLLIVQ